MGDYDPEAGAFKYYEELQSLRTMVQGSFETASSNITKNYNP